MESSILVKSNLEKKIWNKKLVWYADVTGPDNIQLLI